MNCCENQQGFVIVQGDDTNALGEFIVFELETDIDLTGFTAVFQVGELRYSWDDITSKLLYMKFSREETLKLDAGLYYGALKIYDEDGLAVTVIRNIEVNVLPMVVENYTEE